MSQIVLDERQHISVLVGLLTSTGLGTHVYEYGMVPGDQKHPDAETRSQTPPSIYVVVSLSRRGSGDAANFAGGIDVAGWRVTTICVGRTPNEARWARKQVTAALEGTRLSIGEVRSTRITWDTGTEISPDDGLYSGSSTWTYTH